MKKGVFALFKASFADNFPKQLLMFAILLLAIFACAVIILPELLSIVAQGVGYVETSAFYMGFIIVLSVPDKIVTVALIMAAAAMFVSPLACGTSAYMNDFSFRGKQATLASSFRFAKKNYLRLLGVYILYVVITLVSFLGFLFFMYNFLHNMSHVYAENYMAPVVTAWVAGLMLVMGGLLFSPFCAVYRKKGGIRAIVDSYLLLYKGGFIKNALWLLLGAAIWFVIAIIPSYFVLYFIADGAPIESLLFTIDIPVCEPTLWVTMIVSLTIATWFMFNYSHAVYMHARNRR